MTGWLLLADTRRPGNSAYNARSMDGPLKRIEAAFKLWNDGLREDSAALIFIAAAAVSRLRYPRDKHTDRESFRCGFSRTEDPEC